MSKNRVQAVLRSVVRAVYPVRMRVFRAEYRVQTVLETGVNQVPGRV